MAATYKTPGVYVEEIPVFPPSVAEVATAIPAFIGYTERAERNGEDLLRVPVPIGSLPEYHEIFGGAPPGAYTATLDSDDRVTGVTSSHPYLMYESLRLFFENGGGRCYIISVGPFRSAGTQIDESELRGGLAELEKYDEPTIILFPDATLLSGTGLYSLQKLALAQCAKLGDRVLLCDTLPSSETTAGQSFVDRVSGLRDNIGIRDLKYGMAYGPHIRSALPKRISFRDITLMRGGSTVGFGSLTTDSQISQLISDLQAAKGAVDGIAAVVTATPSGILTAGVSTLEEEFKLRHDAAVTAADLTSAQTVYAILTEYFSALKTVQDGLASSAAFDLPSQLADIASSSGFLTTFTTLAGHDNAFREAAGGDELMAVAELADALSVLGLTSADYAGFTSVALTTEYGAAAESERLELARAAIAGFASSLARYQGAVLGAARSYEQTFDQSLEAAFGTYKRIKAAVGAGSSVVPPSGAVAGVYAYVDRTRGVWKAPANVSLNGVSGPVVAITAEAQEGLNVDPVSGKSINAIRTFTGKGVLVWGARTLAGNDDEWRYVPVRRFFNMVEESCKKATEAFVFENNDTNTWVLVKSMLQNYLTLQWRAGALQGAKPADAFYVHVGLGETMTAVDILQGRMIVEIGLAVVRPAEFIVLRFSHKLAVS